MDDDLIQVLIPSWARVSFDMWLNSHQMHILRVPGLGDEDISTYFIAINQSRMENF